jgi:aspartate kinase
MGQVAVVAGFQGVAPDNRLATLGRGGSDTSAVAIAAAVKADRCDIYTDVDGVYTTDPRIEPKARGWKIAFEEMLEMASLGAKVLQVRSVELAMVHKVRTFVRSSFDDPDAPQEWAICSTRPELSFATRKKSWNSKSLPALPTPRTRRRFRSGGEGPPGRFSGNFRPAGRCPHQCRHDRAEHLRPTDRAPT